MLNRNLYSSYNKRLRIAILSNKRDVTSRKVTKVLRRRYTVIYGTDQPELSEDIGVDFSEKENIESFFDYNKVKLLLICSNLLNEEREASSTEMVISSLIASCKRKDIKVIMLYEQQQIVFCGKRSYKILGNDDYYFRICANLSRKIIDGGNGLVIKCPITYGYDFSIGETEWIHNSERKNCGNINNETGMKINDCLLIDEVAEVISSKIDALGEIDLCSREGRKRYYNFSSLSAGIEVINRQKGCVFNLIYQLMPEDYFGRENVAKIRLALGERLALRIPSQLRNQIDCVVPVPRTGLYYAMGLSKALKIPYLQGILKENTQERSFQMMDINDRKRFLRSKLSPIRDLLVGKSVLVVDEAIFTGTTLKMACRMLWEAGVKHIYLGIPTPRCYTSCSHYVQPKREMLLEYIREDMMNEYFDVDNIFFQNIDDFMAAMPKISELCTECFTRRD